jgi:hypothetical protein
MGRLMSSSSSNTRKKVVLLLGLCALTPAFAGRYQEYLDFENGGTEFLLWVPIFLYFYLTKKYDSSTGLIGALLGLGFVYFFPSLATGLLLVATVLLLLGLMFG